MTAPKRRLPEPGYLVSGGVHLVALILLLVTFAKPEQFDPMQETVPIETISNSEFNKVMQGDKSAPKVVPDAAQKVEKTAPEPDPTPKPVAQADKTVPTPPPPPPMPQPVQPPTPPTPPVAAAEPPPPPTPPMPPARPAPSPSVPTPPQRVDVDAEPIAPKPVPTPPKPPERVADAKPVPPPKPHVVPPKPVPRPVPKPPDQLAKFLAEAPDEPVAKPTPKAVKPVKPQPPQPPVLQAAEQPTHNFDLTDLTKLFSHDEPAQKAAAPAARAPSRVASLGSPTARDDKMAPSLWGQLDGLMEEQYRQCWSYLGLTAGQKYVPQIRVMYDESGGLAAEPVLVNPPNDPALRTLAESAMRAVRRCNPLRIPAQYAPYYEEWKGRVLRFDPQEMAG